MPDHLKTISLNRQRANQLKELADAENTTPAKLIEEWTRKARWKLLMSSLDIEHPRSVESSSTDQSRDGLSMKLLETMNKSQLEKSIKTLTPPDWKVSVCCGSDGSGGWVEVRHEKEGVSLSLTSQQARKLGEYLEEMSGNYSGGVKQVPIENGIIQIRRGGRSLRISFELGSEEAPSAASLSNPLGGELGLSLRCAAQHLLL
ncbi:hypothetical protein FIU97_02785 [Roseivivax sp. THAF40]|uniref:hypothetical protein n=1 Tax=Roseivivax sp. THAF40 TaxID=2587858 RepID=UPI0012679024|nr:hypothetical protein [Roseivivax sp. THAF40]QFT45491.1 hypothetical protein FIU97_02785 [Roseivivax sp. THAF40]